MDKLCIMPEQPYCPICPFGYCPIEEGTLEYYDWVCTLTEDKYNKYMEKNKWKKNIIVLFLLITKKKILSNSKKENLFKPKNLEKESKEKIVRKEYFNSYIEAYKQMSFYLFPSINNDWA